MSIYLPTFQEYFASSPTLHEYFTSGGTRILRCSGGGAAIMLLNFSHRAQLRSGVKSCIHLDELLASPGIPRICIRGEIIPGRGSIRADDARVLSRDGATRRLVVFALNRAHIGLRFELQYPFNVFGAPETGGNIISDGDPIGANGARIAWLRYGRAANQSLIFIIAAPEGASLE